MQVIDVHNHFCPEAFLREIERESRAASLSRTVGGETCIHCADVIRAFDITDADKTRILAANAIEPFGIPA